MVTLALIALSLLQSFEVASVKANRSGAARAPSQILPGGRFTATNNTVRDLIRNAYGVFATPYLLTGGPAWIDSARYDIEAKAAAGAIPANTPDQELWSKTRLMLRALLAERFQLVVRREMKEMNVYQLVVAKNGPKLTKSDRDCSAGPNACHGFAGNPRHLAGSGVDMDDLAIALNWSSDRPVINKTAITGTFEILLQWNSSLVPRDPVDDAPRPPSAAREVGGPDASTLPSLSTALEQLGLKLESRKAPVEAYVIERVERPSEN